MSSTNKEVIQAFVDDIVNRGQLERANDLVKEDFVELDPLPGQEQGREGLKAIIFSLRPSFPDMHWTVQEMVAEGEKVVTALCGPAPIAAHFSEFRRPAEASK
ncbi:MAG TPA: ester cyclase [Terracidiphilus sp.]|nr:ester cyclase [Terracidiphilus sp.]